MFLDKALAGGAVVILTSGGGGLGYTLSQSKLKAAKEEKEGKEFKGSYDPTYQEVVENFGFELLSNLEEAEQTKDRKKIIKALSAKEKGLNEEALKTFCEKYLPTKFLEDPSEFLGVVQKCTKLISLSDRAESGGLKPLPTKVDGENRSNLTKGDSKMNEEARTFLQNFKTMFGTNLSRFPEKKQLVGYCIRLNQNFNHLSGFSGLFAMGKLYLTHCVEDSEEQKKALNKSYGTRDELIEF